VVEVTLLGIVVGILIACAAIGAGLLWLCRDWFKGWP